MSDMVVRVIKSSIGNIPVVKAEGPTVNEKEEQQAYGEIIAPKYDISGLKEIVEHSTIIPQCVRAYKNNIPGFGIGIRYKVDDSTKEETPEMKSEWTKLENIIKYINLDKPFNEILGEIVKDKEENGIGYIEVIRNLKTEVDQVEYVDPEYIRATKKNDSVEVTVKRDGQEFKRKKKFRKFIQNINGTKVYFKEFGDPRYLDYKTGEYSEIPIEDDANEILAFKNGRGIYGTTRWIGQTIHVQGSRMAEELNYNYFINGRHTPVMIIIKGGTLSDASWKDLQQYMNDIKGVENSHGFIVLEAEKLQDDVNTMGLQNEKGQSVDVEIKDLSPMLQSDALFQEYLDKSRRKVQSSFNLPDLYVGYTEDFNRATAEAAVEVTERQVFAPERRSLSWIINNVLLADYDFKYVEAYLKSPDLTNPDDVYKIFLAALRGGGATPQDSREILAMVLNKPLDNFEEDWAKTPIEIQRLQTPKQQNQESIIKSNNNINNVLKDVRDVLIELKDKK